MTAGVFSADEWIDRLARVLPGLAEAQEPPLAPQLNHATAP